MNASDNSVTIYSAAGDIFEVYSNVAFSEATGEEVLRKDGEPHEDFIARLVGEIP